MSWFAAILLPRFSLQAVLRWREEDGNLPGAVVEDSTPRGRVLELTHAAAQAGVWPGMASTQAMARCSSLRLWPRSPAQEQIVTSLLLETANTFSPFFEATRDGLCTLDLRTVPGKDWTAWARRVVERFAELRLEVRVGVAANPDLAALAATRAESVLVVQHSAAFLTSIAVAEVDAPPDLVAVLRDWGINHLGELARLPRSEVVDRLGPAAGSLWERATGRVRRELRLVRPVESFLESFDFEYPIETTEPLLFLLRRMLDQLTLRLREVYRVAAKMRLTLPLDGGAAYERLFSIPTPTLDAEVLFRILHTHLETLRLEQQPMGLRLWMEPVAADAQQFQLFESPLRDPNRFGETLGRLAALVGIERVGVVQLADSFQPDRFSLAEPDFIHVSETESKSPAVDLAMGLPLRRFRPPFPAQVRLERHIPAWVFSEKAHGEIIATAGPYRLSGEWWDRGAWAVEEWDVELSDGELYRLAKHNDTWTVEGSYDAALR